ncbi:MAG: cation efflux system protein CusC [Planctomycetota bacterium]|nr:MAG: cation efflux system protein CusC [Planctomycetota bacterium]
MWFSRVLRVAILLTFASAGCRTSNVVVTTPHDEPNGRTASITRMTSNHRSVHHAEHDGDVMPVSFEETSEQILASDADDPFAGRDELALDELVAAVMARNPSLQAALAAWNAAANKYPQAVALDDPMFQSMYAPRSYSGDSNVQASHYFGVAQKFPWPGKREMRGNQANWEAVAASFDAGEAQLRITESARISFFDYFLNQRERELNAASREALSRFRDVARAKYEANQVTQQDVLQADVELAQFEQQQIELNQEQTVAIARINTLLHRRPDHPLPAPPRQLAIRDELPAVEGLREWAVEHRPELQALSARVQAEQSAVALACKEFYPDFEVMGRYDRFWTDREQQPQVGLNMNIPLNQSKRHAAVQEALWRVHKMQADYNQAADTIRGEVQSAYARVRGSRRKIEVFESKILPAAQDNLRAAQSGYEAGTVDFLRLIEAQRQVLGLREKYQMAIADYHRRAAELSRAAGQDVLSVGESLRDSHFPVTE